MITILLLTIYLVGLVVTSTFAAYKTGQEQANMKVLMPQQIMSVNWINCFFQGLLWFGYWAQFFSFRKTLNGMPLNPNQAKAKAAKALDIPMEALRG